MLSLYLRKKQNSAKHSEYKKEMWYKANVKKNPWRPLRKENELDKGECKETQSITSGKSKLVR